jgi:hypothetical protein
MAPPSNLQSIALQLEKVRKNVPTAYEQEHVLLDMIDKRGDVVDASTRNIRLPILVRPGGKGSQGTADFDDMGRGSGSTWDVGTLSTLQFRWAFEVSKLAEYATKGNDKAVEDVAVREVAEAMKMFKRFLDCVYQTDGTGQLDAISAISGNTLTVANPNIFYFNQDVQVYPTGKASAARGIATVTQVDPLLKTITLNALPPGTIVGDALVINISQGAGGANPVSLEGSALQPRGFVLGFVEQPRTLDLPRSIEDPARSRRRSDHHSGIATSRRKQAPPRSRCRFR